MSANTEQYRQSRATWTIADPGASGAIPVDRSGIIPLVTTAAQTRTIATPAKEGIDLTLHLLTDGGDCVITAASAINEAGNTIMTFDNAGEVIKLLSIHAPSGAFMWRVMANDGVGLS